MDKIITVIGATGAQGGGLVDAILAHPERGFKVRAVTRDPNSAKAQALAVAGAEVVEGDLGDPESIRKAFEGSYGVYCVTFFWAHLSTERELEEARVMAQAAKDAGVQHVIWSTLEDTRTFIPLEDDRMPTLHGKYKVPHFDAKGEANHFFTDLGLPVTFLYTTFYWDNFIHFGSGPVRGEDGKLVLTMPMGNEKLAGIASQDIGKSAFGIFQRPDLIGKSVGIAGGHLTGEEMARQLGETIGEQVTYRAIEPAVFRSFGFPGADDLGNMFQFYRDFSGPFLASRDLELTKELDPELLDFPHWLAENAAALKATVSK